MVEGVQQGPVLVGTSLTRWLRSHGLRVGRRFPSARGVGHDCPPFGCSQVLGLKTAPGPAPGGSTGRGVHSLLATVPRPPRPVRCGAGPRQGSGVVGKLP